MASGYIDFIDDDATFEFKWSTEASLTLRTVPDDVEADLRKANQEKKWEQGQRVTEHDGHGFINDVLEYAIRDWKGVRKRNPSTGEVIEVECTPANIRKLPEAVKSEVVRLCLAKEAANMLRVEDEKKDPKKS